VVFKALWPHLEEEARAREVDAKNGLLRRARKESEDLDALLRRQQKEAVGDLQALRQLTLEQLTDKQQRRHADLDIGAMQHRLQNFEQQLAEEPAKIAALYEVTMAARLTPVGLVLAWPEGD